MRLDGQPRTKWTNSWHCLRATIYRSTHCGRGIDGIAVSQVCCWRRECQQCGAMDDSAATAPGLIRVLTMSFHCGTIQSGAGSCPGRGDCPAHNGATKTTTRGGITGAVIIAWSTRSPSLKPPSKDDVVGLRIEFRRWQTLASSVMFTS